MNNNTEKKGIIADVDGTLYKQAPVRILMGLRLCGYYLLHIVKWRELYGIYRFRRFRETSEAAAMSLHDQVLYIAHEVKISYPKLSKAIGKWMFTAPLPLISKFNNYEVTNLLKKAQENGYLIGIYSDYDPTYKLKALCIDSDFIYYPNSTTQIKMKPSTYSTKFILKDMQLSPDNAVFIGDRADKDGKSAEAAGIRYIDVTNQEALKELNEEIH